MPASSGYEEFTEGVAAIDIVTLHGHFGSGEEPWTDNDARPNISDGADGGSDSDARLREDFFSPGVVCEVAEQLLQNILSWRRGEDERPLAFITKDLGGIIVKQALSLASEIPKYAPILCSTFSIVFIQCPHRETARDSVANCIVELICSQPKATLCSGASLIRAAQLAASAAAYVNNEFLSRDFCPICESRVSSQPIQMQGGRSISQY
ncbi:hypothetical protein RB601_001396 [Gaeumannomyces tritici]